MSTFFQNPDPFDEITSSVPMLSPWQAMWNEAEEMLLSARPEGFTPEDVGHVAWDSLPEQEREEALGVLFYTWWAASAADNQTRRTQSEGGAR